MDLQSEFFERDEIQHNVFIAALPDASLVASAGEVAGDARRRLGLSGAPVPPDRLHVSLQAIGGFSGSYPPSVIDTAMTAAGAVSMASFKVTFDRVASFSASRGQRALVLTGDDAGVAGFMRLQQALQHALAKAGLKLPRQSALSPHMTLMYIDRVCDFPIPPIDWIVDRFVLIDSLFGQSRHVHLGQWIFENDDQPPSALRIPPAIRRPRGRPLQRSSSTAAARRATQPWFNG